LVGLYGKELNSDEDDIIKEPNSDEDDFIKNKKTFHNVVEDSEPQYIESDLGD
jgi:hypothetical protein